MHGDSATIQRPPTQIGSVSLSSFPWIENICSLLESVTSAAPWYLFYRNSRHLQELLLQGDEMQPDQEANRKQRGSHWANLHSCPGDVTQRLTRCQYLDFRQGALNADLWPGGRTVGFQLVCGLKISARAGWLWFIVLISSNCELLISIFLINPALHQ